MLVSLLVPAKRIRVEVYDEAGNRYTITFEGRVTRDKALRVLDIVELLGGMPSLHGIKSEDEVTKVDKIRFLVEKSFPVVWFDAKEVQSTYEKELNEHISLSTVSTYLSRLASRGFLLRKRDSNRVQYKIASETLRKMLDLKKEPKVSS